MKNCSKCNSTALITITENDGSARCLICGSRFYNGPVVTDIGYTEREYTPRKKHLSKYERRMEPHDVICTVCGDSYQSCGHNSRYCSEECKKQAAKKQRTRLCRGCGEVRWIAKHGLCMKCVYWEENGKATDHRSAGKADSAAASELLQAR